ncbi:spt3-like transcription factor [Fusarium heterosporum]|uniref:Spt3-like transcription factor n=1 Tax=Fusarium heterosporum TaxID=42747 RepID=A0A8H5X2D7_FUSHE|nr:spt3-like transcription factor [Fusarium heterosporum]
MANIAPKTIPKYAAEIQQMMFCAGEKQDVSLETLTLIEEIVRNQVIHLLTTANELATRRGQRTFSINDIIFQIRHDQSRLARVQSLMRWRAIRRAANTKDNDNGEINLDDAEEIEETLGNGIADCLSRKTEAPGTLLPWDVEHFFSVQPPGGASNEALLQESSKDSLQRLCWADEITRGMSAEEYAKYADYRHASFTSRKKERFRKWVGIGVIAEPRKKEDILEIIGFMAVEIVKKLTDMALSIQDQELTAQRRKVDQTAPAGERRHGLFVSPHPERPPIDVRHIRRAFQQTQMRPKRRRVQMNRVANRKALEMI